MVDTGECERVPRHVWNGGVGRILHDRKPFAILDGAKARDAVVAGAAENDADDPRAVGVCRRSKERIDSRPVAILARAVDDFDSAFSDEKVSIRSSHVNATAPDPIAVGGRDAVEPCDAIEDLRQQIVRIGWQVQNNEYCSGKICWEADHEFLEGLNASC